MKREIDIRVLPEQLSDATKIEKLIRRKGRIPPKFPLFYQLKKKSLDARKFPAKYQLRYLVSDIDDLSISDEYYRAEVLPQDAKRIVVVGAGPAGLFAALKLLQLGLKPIVLERGKDVRARRRDLALLSKEHLINPESNYCFGEGGAGTYSDGKLYTRAHKRGVIAEVLEWFVHFGADTNILVEAHPHIGTNKLPAIIVAMREMICDLGGEVRFGTKMCDLKIKEDRISAVIDQNGNEYAGEAVLLATGHSARDIFYLLQKKKIKIEAKPFALGVRVEHPQLFIDQRQYSHHKRSQHLPPAAYSLADRVRDRGVYSFCMCPGGVIAPCATAPGEIVTNGWSPSKRNNPYANSGIVVEVRLSDLSSKDPMAALEFQAEVERKACIEAGGNQTAPALRLEDFVENRLSKTLPKSSYFPGTEAVDFRSFLPPFILKTLQEGFRMFHKKIRGFIHEEAIVLGPESRTSSPIRIPRNPETLHHPDCHNLYPCAEGAGYAGGIVSAALDGINCAKSIAAKVKA